MGDLETLQRIDNLLEQALQHAKALKFQTELADHIELTRAIAATYSLLLSQPRRAK